MLVYVRARTHLTMDFRAFIRKKSYHAMKKSFELVKWWIILFECWMCFEMISSVVRLGNISNLNQRSIISWKARHRKKMYDNMTYLARSSANSASNFSLHARNVSTVTGSPCGTTIWKITGRTHNLLVRIIGILTTMFSSISMDNMQTTNNRA